VSSAICNHTVLHASTYRWTCLALAPATQADHTQFIPIITKEDLPNGLSATVVNVESVNSFKNAYDRLCCKYMRDTSWPAACPLIYKYNWDNKAKWLEILTATWNQTAWTLRTVFVDNWTDFPNSQKSLDFYCKSLFLDCTYTPYSAPYCQFVIKTKTDR